MGMDTLRYKTPDMVCKEIVMHMIAYNCVRQLIFESAQRFCVDLRRVSFKGSLQAIRQWEPHLKQAHSSFIKRQERLSKLYQLIVSLVVLEHPNRREPRVLKRRSKNHQLMMVPRSVMMEVPH